MAKSILQITVTKSNAPKTKLGYWFYWNIYWRIWRIWRPKIMSKFYFVVSRIMLSVLPKEKREELLKETEDIEVHIINKT